MKKEKNKPMKDKTKIPNGIRDCTEQVIQTKGKE